MIFIALFENLLGMKELRFLSRTQERLLYIITPFVNKIGTLTVIVPGKSTPVFEALFDNLKRDGLHSRCQETEIQFCLCFTTVELIGFGKILWTHISFPIHFERN